jgi:pimeloyl-ACP methyl ester carboxylesterase
MLTVLIRGAKTAMTVALRNPALVEALIPVDNSPVDAALKNDFRTYVQGMKMIEDSKVKRQKDADDILKGYEESLPIRQFLLTNLMRTQDADYLKFRVPLKILTTNLDKMGDFPFNDPDKARYEGPTLFIRGTRSPYVADDVLPVIGRFFPRFQLVDIESGHWVISEKPEEFRKGRLSLPTIDFVLTSLAVVDFMKTAIKDE